MKCYAIWVYNNFTLDFHCIDRALSPSLLWRCKRVDGSTGI